VKKRGCKILGEIPVSPFGPWVTDQILSIPPKLKEKII